MVGRGHFYTIIISMRRIAKDGDLAKYSKFKALFVVFLYFTIVYSYKNHILKLTKDLIVNDLRFSVMFDNS